MKIGARVGGTAVAVLASVTVAACGGGISDQDHRDFVAGCEHSGQSAARCECVFQQLTGKQGLSSLDQLNGVLGEVEHAVAAHDLSKIPASFRNAALACKNA